MSTETWKPIYSFNGIYEVSDYGNIRRILPTCKISISALQEMRRMRESGLIFREIAARFGVTKRAVIKALSYKYKRQPLRMPYRIIKPQISSHGYATVGLCKDGKPKVRYIHALVARAFLGVPPLGMEVNHKNGVRNDPRLENLEYVTRSGNALHSIYVLKTPHSGRKKSR